MEPLEISETNRAQQHLAPATKGIIRRLFERGREFGFFQAVWLLENLEAGRIGGPEAGGVEKIRFRPSDSGVFPPTDVRQIDLLDDGSVRFTVNFMGLYGSDSPLPVCFHREIREDNDEADAHRDFLDIFNHRLYRYFYESWKKYRPGLHLDRSYDNPHTRVFLSVAGLGTAGSVPEVGIHPLRLAAFGGLLGGCARNAEGLHAILSGLLKTIPVRVLENVPRWVPIPDRPRLGGGARFPMQLGTSATIGERIFDVSGKFRVELGPLSLSEYSRLLPEGDLAQETGAVIRLYVPDYLDYDVRLILATDELTPVRLGDKKMRLGMNTWLGRPTSNITSEIVNYD